MTTPIPLTAIEALRLTCRHCGVAIVMPLAETREARVGRNNQRALRRMFAVPVQCAALIAPYGAVQDIEIPASLSASGV